MWPETLDGCGASDLLLVQGEGSRIFRTGVEVLKPDGAPRSLRPLTHDGPPSASWSGDERILDRVRARRPMAAQGRLG